MNQYYDIAIIGAGVVGSAIARALSRYDLKIVLLESHADIGMGTSKASTAIWHTGFDAQPGSLEATLMRRSYPLMEIFMREVGSPFERIGGLLIAWTPEQFNLLPSLMEKAHKNGVTDICLFSKEEIYQREPDLGVGVLGGMFVPSEGILCTYTVPLACATQAVVNGVTLKVNTSVTGIVSKEAVHIITSKDEMITAAWIINAAGLFSDDINKFFGHEEFTVTPRRGELIVYDKLARRLVNHILLPIPTAITKGVLISPTIYGNVLLGPTAEDLSDKTATNTSASGLLSLLDKGRKLLPKLLAEEVTATYAGLRAATEHSDYQIKLDAKQQYIGVGGIRSTGISGCLGIAEYVVDLLRANGLDLQAKSEFKTIKMPNIGEAFVRPYQDAALIAENSEYGQIICHCERVTLGEIKDAMMSEIPARGLDALRRRTRVMQGRCQGFNCQAYLQALLKEDSTPTSMKTTHSHALPPNKITPADVLIIGAGPAGLATAVELRRHGIKNIIMVERESVAGGIPRFCQHPGFGLRDWHRVLTGPAYAQKYREIATSAGIKIYTNTTITGWHDRDDDGRSTLDFTSPDAIGKIEAQAVVLATGVRERPRSARLIPGYRPLGIFTTGSLQRHVYEHRLPIGKRAVIVGAELVSLSAVMTLMHAGIKVVNIITALPNHQMYFPLAQLAKFLYVDMLARAQVLTNTQVVNILGKERVEAIEIRQFDNLSVSAIECDTVVFTGDWIPENELARQGALETLSPSSGPQVDADFRTSQMGVFAAGNLLRGVESADWAALEGQKTARSVDRWLTQAQWSTRRLGIVCTAPLRWITPNVLSPDVQVTALRFWSQEFRRNVSLQIKQGERILDEKHFRILRANVALNLSSDWIKKVDMDNPDVPITLVISS